MAICENTIAFFVTLLRDLLSFEIGEGAKGILGGGIATLPPLATALVHIQGIYVNLLYFSNSIAIEVIRVCLLYLLYMHILYLRLKVVSWVYEYLRLFIHYYLEWQCKKFFKNKSTRMYGTLNRAINYKLIFETKALPCKVRSVSVVMYTLYQITPCLILLIWNSASPRDLLKCQCLPQNK